MRSVKIEELRNTVKTIRRKKEDECMNVAKPSDELPEHPPFKFAPGMVNGRGEVINPEEQR